MRLNSTEILQLRAYLQGQVTSLSEPLVAKLELGVWVFPSSEWPFPLIYGVSLRAPFLLMGSFGLTATQKLLDAFRERTLPYLMVRVDSWEAYLNCNGEILTEHCDEDLDAIRAACERLRERCGSWVPSVMV